jgi:putative oxidoreductase
MQANAFLSRYSPVLLSILRIVVAFLFIEHGAQKLLGVPGAGDHKVELMSLMGVAGVLELFGGALVLLGLFTRPLRSCSPAKWRSRTSWRTRRRDSGRC